MSVRAALQATTVYREGRRLAIMCLVFELPDLERYHPLSSSEFSDIILYLLPSWDLRSVHSSPKVSALLPLTIYMNTFSPLLYHYEKPLVARVVAGICKFQTTKARRHCE